MRRIVLLTAAALALLAPSAAGAAVRVPANAKVVAGPTPSGARLLAFERGDEVCLVVRPADRGVDDPECSPVPDRPSRALRVYRYADDDHAAHGGAVPAAVAHVQLRFALPSGRLEVDPDEAIEADASAPSVAGLRYYLTDGPSYSPWLIRLLDGNGTTLFARDESFEGPIVEPPALIARGSRATRLYAVTRLKLAATPLDRGRLIRETCLTLFNGDDETGGGCVSADTPVPDPVEAFPAQQCGVTNLPVLAADGIARVVAVLGDGRRAAVPLVTLSGSLTALGARAGALTIRGASAVRRLEAFGPDGRLAHVVEVGLAPAKPCRGGLGSSFALYADDFGHDLDGPLRASARDEGATLCFSLADFDPRRRDCALPPDEPRFAFLQVRRVGDRALVGGVLPEEVAAVELSVDGLVRRLPTTDDLPGYGGQYRGLVRFFAVELPASSQIDAARLLSASGRILNGRAVFDEREQRTLRSRRIVMNGRAVRIDRLSRDRDPATPDVCVRMSDGCQPLFPTFVKVDVPCAPRARIVVAGAAPGRVRIATDRGPVTPRMLVVAGRRIFVAVLPRHAALRTIVAGRMRQPLELPAATRQCGYGDFASLDRP